MENFKLKKIIREEVKKILSEYNQEEDDVVTINPEENLGVDYPGRI